MEKIRLLSSIQNPTPTAALETILDLPPLLILMQGAAQADTGTKPNKPIVWSTKQKAGWGIRGRSRTRNFRKLYGSTVQFHKNGPPVNAGEWLIRVIGNLTLVVEQSFPEFGRRSFNELSDCLINGGSFHHSRNSTAPII